MDKLSGSSSKQRKAKPKHHVSDSVSEPETGLSALDSFMKVL
jgi:hypothetical protein